jgi:hypothetical protein
MINNVFYVKGGTFGGNGRGTPINVMVTLIMGWQNETDLGC